ncbi:hypothetical protein [Nonomuraea rubra]|uniref:Uncharacterized protein n=1 Tax=Nonomuraea rubra TaxID=46180 RepID=A0A7X0NUW2_9ACTN|nr:hypothetical protein [Nonomuraea rubra]MBB6550089.1 hypothetical protein [Nonomuraea rubra]
MMEAVAELAMTGAATVVAAMATDAWQSARTRAAALLGRGDEEQRELAETRLERAAAEVEAADPGDRDEVRRRIAAAWQVRLMDLVEAHPETEAELRRVIEELSGRLPAAQQSWVQHITAEGQGSVAQGVMFGNIINHRAAPE